jgi:hypothetical protein
MYKHGFRDRERIRRQAAYLVDRALANGELTKPARCQECGAEAGQPRGIRHWADHAWRRGAITMVEAHHADYGRPLDVVWLCGPCRMLAELRDGDARYRGVASPPGVAGRDDRR